MKKKWLSWLALAMPYVLTALVPVVSVVFLGRMILSNYQEKIISDRQVSLESAFDRTLQKLDTVENLSYMLGVNDVIEQYSYACLNHSGHDTFDYMEVKNLLASAAANPVIHEIYLFDSKDNCVISASTALSNMEVYFQYPYKIEGYTVQESIDRLENMGRESKYCPAIEVSLSNASASNILKKIVEYRAYLPMGWIRNSQSQLIFAMDAAELFGDFEDVIHAGGEIYVYDSNDILIYGSGDRYENLLQLTDSEEIRQIQAGDAVLYGAVLHSPNNVWKVKVYIPNLLGVGMLSFMSPAIWGFVVFPVVASILLSIYFTHKNHKEILDLLNVFRSHTESRELSGKQEEEVGYKIIREYADKIITENNRFKERMSNYEYSRKYEVLDKLVRNTYKSREEAAEALAETDLKIQDGKSVVLCIRYEGASYRTAISEDVTIKDFVKYLLGDLIERQYELFDTSARETICVISIDDNENMDIIVRDIISHLNVEIAYYYGIEVNIGAGNIADTVYQLGASYEQARAVIRYSESSGNKVNLYSELVLLEDVYYYPREYDDKIYNYVVVGKADEAKKLIRRIYEENFVKNTRMLSVRAIENVKSRLWDCLVSLAEKYDISLERQVGDEQEPAVKQLPTEINAKSYFALVYRIVDLLAEEIQDKKKLVQNNSVTRIMNYVHENYCDNTLSLKQISVTFGFHENYISNLFKNAYGENLSVYIEKLRIEKASELIRNTEMKISEIAKAVGYTSDASFRRAFKKITGVSPGEYRQK